MKKDVCEKGQSCGSSCIKKSYKCEGTIGDPKITENLKNLNTFDFDTLIAEGLYGSVFLDSKNKIVKKTLKDRQLKDGSPNKFGDYELEIATKMGEVNYGPKVYKDLSNESQIVMDLVKGKTLWKSYSKDTETEPDSFPEDQAKEIIRALTYLQKKLGFAHNDFHILQIIVDDDKPKIVDFGLSLPIKGNEKKGLNDWSKSFSFLGLARFESDPEFARIAIILKNYKQIKGSSKKALEEKALVLKDYTSWLNDDL